MRVLALFGLIAVLVGAGCEAPERVVDQSPPATSIPRDLIFPGAIPIPSDFPAEGKPVWQARRDRAHDVWVLGSGTVTRILRDDTKPPRHQRFVVDTGERSTVLVAHNIDVAPRVPLKRGDLVAFRGQYEWNDQGGVVHWTHRDKRDKNSGGWILWKGQNFR